MINSETKIKKIEGLSKEYFIEMMNNLLIKMSYKEIKNEAGYFLTFTYLKKNRRNFRFVPDFICNFVES